MLKFHALRVSDLQPDADDAVAVALEVPEELRSEYTGLPGQHIVLRTNLDGTEQRRTYSLVNAPGEWPLRIVARVLGRMSKHLAEHVRVGDTIDVLPPNGSLSARLNDTRSLSATSGRTFVGFASGCGVTPLVSVAKALLKAHPRNEFILFYGNSTTGRTMCLEELLALKDRHLDRLSLHFVMSREPQEVELYNGRVDSVRVRELAKTLFDVERVAEFFVCGPGDMIEQVSGALRELNVAGDRIHAEHFTVADQGDMRAAPPSGSQEQTAGASHSRSQSSAPSGTTAPQPAEKANVAEVVVQMDGRRRSFTMRMNDETVLDAASRAGLDLPFSCRAGVCSTCRTKVVTGEVSMDQNYALEEWELEQGYVLACQARCKTPALELDYDEK